MISKPGLEAIEYLIIGHLTKDISQEGEQVGGTAAYAALTSLAMGQKVGVLSSWADDLPLHWAETNGIELLRVPSEQSTTFENLTTTAGRRQKLHARAASLAYHHIPELWREVPFLHLAPVIQEVDASILQHFPYAKILLTPQGWFRERDNDGNVQFADWPEACFIVRQADLVVISDEDIQHNESLLHSLIDSAQILVLTQGERGAKVFHHGVELQIAAPYRQPLDSTGAGDIFATAFFVQYNQTKDLVKAGTLAAKAAARSVGYAGLDAVPKKEHIQQWLLEDR